MWHQVKPSICITRRMWTIRHEQTANPFSTVRAGRFRHRLGDFSARGTGGAGCFHAYFFEHSAAHFRAGCAGFACVMGGQRWCAMGGRSDRQHVPASVPASVPARSTGVYRRIYGFGDLYLEYLPGGRDQPNDLLGDIHRFGGGYGRQYRLCRKADPGLHRVTFHSMGIDREFASSKIHCH